MSELITGGLTPESNREGIFGRPLPDGVESFAPGVHDHNMMRAMAEEHLRRIEEVRQPDGTVPEVVYGKDGIGSVISPPELKGHIVIDGEIYPKEYFG